MWLKAFGNAEELKGAVATLGWSLQIKQLLCQCNIFLSDTRSTGESRRGLTTEIIQFGAFLPDKHLRPFLSNCCQKKEKKKKQKKKKTKHERPRKGQGQGRARRGRGPREDQGEQGRGEQGGRDGRASGRILGNGPLC